MPGWRLVTALLLLVAGSPARATSFLPCRHKVVEVPAHPRVITEGRNPSDLEIRREGGDMRPVRRAGIALDAEHASVTLGLEVGESAFVDRFLGPRCSGRTMKVVANWKADRSAPPAPEVAPSDKEVQIVWDEERKNETWWMRLDWAATEDELSRHGHAFTFASWIEWIDLAPGASIELRMVRLLPDGSESAPWQGTVVRAPDGSVQVHSHGASRGRAVPQRPHAVIRARVAPVDAAVPASVSATPVAGTGEVTGVSEGLTALLIGLWLGRARGTQAAHSLLER